MPIFRPLLNYGQVVAVRKITVIVALYFLQRLCVFVYVCVRDGVCVCVCVSDGVCVCVCVQYNTIFVSVNNGREKNLVARSRGSAKITVYNFRE